MKYFNLHPILKHTIPHFGTVDEIELKNLFEIRNLYLSNNKSFFLQIGNKIFPEEVADQFLENPDDSWLIYLINNLRSRFDWPETVEEKLRILSNKYQNQTVYFIQNLPSLEINDIVVKTNDLHTSGSTFQKLGIVLEWNPYLRAFRTLHSNGLSFDEGDIVTFIRKENSDYKILNFLNMGETSSSGFTYSIQIKRKENPINVPLNFIQGQNIISAYYNLNLTSPGNTYINQETLGISGPNGFTFTVLFSYMNRGFTGVNTIEDDIKIQEISKIKVPKNNNMTITNVLMKQAFLDPNHTDIIDI